MCDQTPAYSDGDVVWVKCNSVWWPGMVKDVEKDGTSKELFAGMRKPPLVTVKFFDENTYEFVKNLDNIYHYNSKKKDEFLKKGLDKFRSGAEFMKKFPLDVAKAEELTYGNVDIINDPKYAPEKKPDYHDIFGPPKLKKDKDHLASRLPIKKRQSAPYLSTKSASPWPVAKKLKKDDDKPYRCHICGFSATLAATVSSHFKYAHSSSRVNFDPNADKSQPEKVPRLSLPTKKSVKTPKASEKPKESAEKRKPEVKETKQKKKEEKPPEKKKRYTDALLNDWIDEDVDEPLTTLSEPEVVKTAVEPEPPEEKKESKNEEAETSKESNAEPGKSASCFDFDEEDDGFIGMSNANTYGRKIPRVIPVKDKTELGMDLDIEELFKRKPPASDEPSDKEEEDEEEEVPKKRRGRSKKAAAKKPANKKPTKAAKQTATLASTRERRPAARKSYIDEVIRKIDDKSEESEKEDDPAEVEESDKEEEPKVQTTPAKTDDKEEEKIVDETTTSAKAEDLEDSEQESRKPSRRKQDLKKSSLVELDELKLPVSPKKIVEEVKAKYVKIVAKKKPSANLDDDVSAQVESLLAETTAPSIAKPDVRPKTKFTEEEIMNSTVEYLDDEVAPKTSPTVKSSPIKIMPTISPIKKWKDDLKMALDGEAVVKKSAIPQWKQGIQEALAKSSKEETIVLNEPVQKPVQKPPTVVQKKDGTYLLVSHPQRPKILGKSPGQQVVLMKTRAGAQTRVVAANPISSQQSSPQKVVKIIQDGQGGKKIIQLGTKSPQKVLISGRSEGLSFIKNFNGSGKNYLVRQRPLGTGASGQRTIGISTKSPEGISVGGAQRQRILTHRIKQPDGTYKTVQKLVKVGTASTSSVQGAQQQPKQFIYYVKKPPATIETPVVVATEPIVEEVPEVPVEEPAAVLSDSITMQTTPTQVVAMPVTQEGQTTYIYMTCDESGNYQQCDSSLLASYNVQSDDSGQIFATVAQPEELTTAYTSSKDIVAEALANCDVDETEPMIPLEMSANIMTDPTALLVAPHVQETSVTLQKPIMTPVERPSSVVANTAGLEPPPLPPTPDDNVLMEDEGGLMIAEGEADDATDSAQPPETQQVVPEHNEQVENFFFEEQGGEESAFQSMPSLNEDPAVEASEEPIGDQSFQRQMLQISSDDVNEFEPTSTNSDLEPVPEEDNTREQEGSGDKDASSMPFVAEDGFPTRSQDTEVTSTTPDSRDGDNAE